MRRIKRRQTKKSAIVRIKRAKKRIAPRISIRRVIWGSEPNTKGIGPRKTTPPHRREREASGGAHSCGGDSGRTLEGTIAGGDEGANRNGQKKNVSANPRKTRRIPRNARGPVPTMTGTTRTR